MTNPATDMPELDVTDADYDEAREFYQDDFRVKDLAKYVCRERQLLAALARIASLESLVREMAENLHSEGYNGECGLPDCQTCKWVKRADELLKESK